MRPKKLITPSIIAAAITDFVAPQMISPVMISSKERGVAIIMISSELPEILGMSDRILVMHEGRINGEFLTKEATQEMILRRALGE